MKVVVVLIKSFKKDCGSIGVAAAKISSYFVTCLLIFHLHFQYSYVENGLFLLSKEDA